MLHCSSFAFDRAQRNSYYPWLKAFHRNFQSATFLLSTRFVLSRLGLSLIFQYGPYVSSTISNCYHIQAISITYYTSSCFCVLFSFDNVLLAFLFAESALQYRSAKIYRLSALLFFALVVGLLSFTVQKSCGLVSSDAMFSFPSFQHGSFVIYRIFGWIGAVGTCIV